ncbi:MAG: DUF4301 family protein [Bacteroidota bacterium]
MFNLKDLSLLEKRRITEKEINAQVARFKKGFETLRLVDAATVGNGIVRIDDSRINELITYYESAEVSVLKFVPASGAASRMFKSLFALLDLDDKNYLENDQTKQFFNSIWDFAFCDDLKDAFNAKYKESFEESVKKKDKRIVSSLLLDEGLAYGSLPKGLLKFHRYEDHVRTPAHEHIYEGLAYASKSGNVNIHFTVSPNHQKKFESYIDKLLSSLQLDAHINITYSTQKISTDTIAVDLGNDLFRDDEGNLLFRPAGHGALLENLGQLDADIVFIKNIDNVVPDRIKEETISYKKALAGILLTYQSRAFELLRSAERGGNIKDKGIALLREMGTDGLLSEEEIIHKLNRPIRVCGMVKNEGEPGGGPFWVKSGGNLTLQIVESAQVDTKASDQESIFVKSTHFNPVDLVCGLKDYNGEPFDLLKFRDDNTGFITEKSYQGRKLKAMELPGLWNGSMADWNTIFVEVPLITFNPVKTVMDLLKENHQ